jgi:hypothetical protein
MKLHYGNSSLEQKDYLERCIRDDILCLDNELAELVLKSDEEGSSYDCVRNLYVPTCPECGEQAEMSAGTWIPQCRCGLAEDEDGEESRTEDWDLEPQEVFQWFRVRDSVARELAEIGEPVMETPAGNNLWGRTCYGQAIILDPTWWILYQEQLKEIK